MSRGSQVDTSAMVTSATEGHGVLSTLERTSSRRGLGDMAARLAELRAMLDGDLQDVERVIASLAGGPTVAHKTARHLLELPGKRLRPVCVALASRVGGAFTEAARVYAVAVELVHSATLLHDDVIDLGDARRGEPAARVIYGNAASIFGGDYLLVEALERIQQVGDSEVLVRILGVIRQMVIAEALQLERRGRIALDRRDYFAVIEGKTASLFRWAMFAGARAGGVSDDSARALELYGDKLGIAFQIVDDLLDVVGDPAVTGKAALVDLREGKMTYPLLVALERDPALAPDLEALTAQHDAGLERPDPALERKVADAIGAREVESECFALAERLAGEAVCALASVPDGPAKSALESVAATSLQRRK